MLEGYNLLDMSDVGIVTVFKSKDAAMALLANGIGMYNVSFFQNILALHLQKQFKVESKNMGYYYALLSFPYFFSALIIPVIFKNTPRRLQFVICYFLSAIAMMLNGPSRVFGLPNEKYLIMIGLPILGFVQALLFIPSMPEAIECIQHKYKIVESTNMELDNKLNDVMGSMVSFTINLCGLFAPIIGGYMYEYIGGTNKDGEQLDENLSYRMTWDYNMFFEVFIMVVYIVFSCKGHMVFKDTREQQEYISEMKKISEEISKDDKK